MMKAKPYLLLLPLVLIVLFTQCEKERNPVNIPDDAFLNALIKNGVDINGDGLISYPEAEAVTDLYVSESGISNMRGIGTFVNLKNLYCTDNRLTNLDISNNYDLIQLICTTNQLTSLDVSNNTRLQTLRCHYNQLTSLDVSKNTALGSLHCPDNKLTSLDVSNNTDLIVLSCGGNQLTSLDVSNLSLLRLLFCSGNQLTRLDISNNPNLELLTQGYCSLDIGNMPSLTEVCVWTMPFPPEDFNLCMDGSPNVYFTTECSK